MSKQKPRGWVGAFNASISLGSLFERLLGWDDDDASPAPHSPLSQQVPTIVELDSTLFDEWTSTLAKKLRWSTTNPLPTRTHCNIIPKLRLHYRIPPSTLEKHWHFEQFPFRI